MLGKTNATVDGASNVEISELNSKITNCITEIPQDIKLEINSDNKAVAKAGTKYYIPNGANKFDVYTLPSDLIFNFSSNQNGSYFLSINSNGSAGWATVSEAASGTSTDATTSFYYRTNENKIKYQNNTSTTVIYSFPLAIVDVVNGVGTIKQVFNGFGYIGSTTYALPGVKGLIPDGRNTDGSLKNIEFTVDKIITCTSTTPMNFYFVITPYSLTSGNGYMVSTSGYTTSETPPNTNRWFKPSENMYYFNRNGVWGVDKQVHLGFGVNTANAITSFTPKLPFRAVDYNDFNQEVSKLNSNTPTGSVLPFAGSTAPSGFLICDGSAISRTTYANLFNVIGTTYGTGNGSTTFNLPNYSNARFITNSTVSVIGTGALGLTTGSTVDYALSYSQQSALKHRATAGGVELPQTSSASFGNASDNLLGVSTDPTKSGLIGTASLASSCKFIIKY